MFKDDKPPTSKDEAWARRVRPPPEKYDPDKRSRWSITMTVAWIIWHDRDAVRNQYDDYRNECADWRFEGNASARAKVADIAMAVISTAQIAPCDPDLQKGLIAPPPPFKARDLDATFLLDLQKDLQKGSWQLREWGLSGWKGLRLRALPENPQVAIGELWHAAEEGRIKATALEYENDKAYVGKPIEIPTHYWSYLRPIDDPLTGKAMLSGPDGRVYREVQFSQLDVKELWPREGEEVHGAGAWITAEARRMKAANEILPDIRISDFARELEGRMKKAAKKAATTNKPLRAVGWRYIKNKLREWDLWPVSSI
jgi:hypothetical protein